MTKRQFLVILYLLVEIIPLIAQTFTEQKKSYPVNADGNKYVGRIAISCLTVGVQEEKTQADTMSKELLSFLNMRLTI